MPAERLLCYTAGMRRLILIALILLTILIVAAVSLQPVRSRIAALPHRIRTELNALQPTAVIPTPLPVSVVSREELLATAPATTTTPYPSPTAFRLLPATTTPVPTFIPTATPTPSATPVRLTPVAPAVSLAGFTHAWQTWNNCGPTTISMYLSYYGLQASQEQAAAMLKPNADDKNVSPEELAEYARAQGFEALVRLNGDADLLQALLSNGFPVIVETWLDPEDRGGLGHYRLLSGYDQATRSFIAQDSLRGPDVLVPADEFDDLWRVFNRKYVLVFRPEDAERLRAILGPATDDVQMLRAALQQAQAEAREDSDDPYSWFNIGSIYVALGEMELAAGAFDEARRIGLPYRMLWYQFEPFEAYLATARYSEVIDLATAVLDGTGGLEELYYYRGLARHALGEQDAAAGDFRAALDYNPLYLPADLALQSNVTPTPALTNP